MRGVSDAGRSSHNERSTACSKACLHELQRGGAPDAGVGTAVASGAACSRKEGASAALLRVDVSRLVLFEEFWNEKLWPVREGGGRNCLLPPVLVWR